MLISGYFMPAMITIIYDNNYNLKAYENSYAKLESL